MATMSCTSWEMMSCKKHLILIFKAFLWRMLICSPILFPYGKGMMVGCVDGWIVRLVEDLWLALSLMVPICSHQTLQGLVRLTLKTFSKQFEILRCSSMYYFLACTVWQSSWMTCAWLTCSSKNQGVPLMINIMWCCRWAPQMVEGRGITQAHFDGFLFRATCFGRMYWVSPSNPGRHGCSANKPWDIMVCVLSDGKIVCSCKTWGVRMCKDHSKVCTPLQHQRHGSLRVGAVLMPSSGRGSKGQGSATWPLAQSILMASWQFIMGSLTAMDHGSFSIHNQYLMKLTCCSARFLLLKFWTVGAVLHY